MFVQNNEASQDWSTQVANSSPLPKRKPVSAFFSKFTATQYYRIDVQGMRHPGIERRRTGKDSKSGPIGSSKHLKRLQSKGKKRGNSSQNQRSRLLVQ